MTGSIASIYTGMLADGRLRPDPAQADIVRQLDGLASRIEAHRLARKGSALGWLFSKNTPEEPLRGLYVWGGVGRGKTFLVDLFHARLNVQRKRRAHFHAFMADVHARIHDWRQRAKRGEVRGEDPIAPVAQALAAEAWVLCFDEFSVTDIADAMILGRLFQALFAQGVVIVATSNVEPSHLYENGLNRSLFLPFIAMLQAHMQIVRLDANQDYRLEKLKGRKVYYSPADAAARLALDEAFADLGGGGRMLPRDLDVGGRPMHVARAAGGAARFSFAELCEAPLGALDYLALARNFHSILIDDVPQLDFARRNASKRFITLVDILYENHVKLIVSAEVPPEELYVAEQGHEAFEFDRTISRLSEMQSEAYLSLPPGRSSARARGASAGLVET